MGHDFCRRSTFSSQFSHFFSNAELFSSHCLFVADVQSGVLYVVVLTTDGRAFQWGNICTEEDKDTAVYQLNFLSGSAMENERITQIACGDFHAMALTSEGQVYSWGGNDQGQLGIGPEEGDSGPTIVSRIHGPVSQIACGGHTSFALDIEGSVSGSVLSGCSSY